MFVVRFIRKDGQPDELYYYHSLEEARNHIYLFTEDNSNLYRNISVLNEDTNYIMDYIYFDKLGKSYGLIQEGDVVRLRKEWRSEGEEKYLFLVTNINENFDNCLIKCLNSSISLGSSEGVKTYMIKRV